MVWKVLKRVAKLWPLAIDLSWIVKIVSWAVGLMAAVLATVEGWLNSLVLAQQIVLFVGMAIVVSGIMTALIGLMEPLYRRLQRWAEGTGAPAQAMPISEEAAAPAPSGERDELFRFDSHSLIADIVKPDLMHISELYVDFEISIRNLSGRRVKIEGFAGMVSIAGAECAQPPSLSGAQTWREPESRDGGETYVLRQPITSQMAQQLYGGTGGGLAKEQWSKRIDLSSVRMIGVYEEEGEARDLPDDCLLRGVTFLLKGPIENEAEAQAIHRLPTTFVSQEQYDSDGVRKQVKEIGPPIEPGSEAVTIADSSLGGMLRLDITNPDDPMPMGVYVDQIVGTNLKGEGYYPTWRLDGADRFVLVGDSPVTINLAELSGDVDALLGGDKRLLPLVFFSSKEDDGEYHVITFPRDVDRDNFHFRITVRDKSGALRARTTFGLRHGELSLVPDPTPQPTLDR